MKELIKLKKDELLLNQKRSFDVKSLNPYFLEIILNEKKELMKNIPLEKRSFDKLNTIGKYMKDFNSGILDDEIDEDDEKNEDEHKNEHKKSRIYLDLKKNLHQNDQFLLRLCDVENKIGFIALRLIIAIVYILANDLLQEEKNEIAKYEKMKKIIQFYFENNARQLRSKKMLENLELENLYWTDDWHTRFSEISNLADAFFKNNQKTFENKFSKKTFNEYEKISLLWTFENKSNPKFSVTRKIPVLNITSTYLCKTFIPQSSIGIPVTLQKIFFTINYLVEYLKKELIQRRKTKNKILKKSKFQKKLTKNIFI